MKIEIHKHPGAPDDETTLTVTNTSPNKLGIPTDFLVEPAAASEVVLRNVFDGITAITTDGEVLAFNMRDSGFECVYQCGDHIESFSLQRGEIGWEMFPKQVKPDPPTDHLDMLEAAWGIIANGAYWDQTSAKGCAEWEAAVLRWRDRYHEILDKQVKS